MEFWDWYNALIARGVNDNVARDEIPTLMAAYTSIEQVPTRLLNSYILRSGGHVEIDDVDRLPVMIVDDGPGDGLPWEPTTTIDIARKPAPMPPDVLGMPERIAPRIAPRPFSWPVLLGVGAVAYLLFFSKRS